MFLLQASDISIEHRWEVSLMFTLSKIAQGIDGLLYSLLPKSRAVIRETRQTSNPNSRAFNVIDHRRGQFSRIFGMNVQRILCHSKV